MPPDTPRALRQIQRWLPRKQITGREYLVAGAVGGAVLLALALLAIGLRNEEADPEPRIAAEPAGTQLASSAEPVPARPARPTPIPIPEEPARSASAPQPVKLPSYEQAADRPSRQPAARSSLPPPRTGGGLVGVSREYDDTHCQQIQLAHGIRIPAAATILEVDGVRLPVAQPGALAQRPAAILMLPRGRHSVRFRTSDMPVEIEIDTHLFDEYQAMRKFFGLPGSVNTQELLSRGARAFDVHGAPFLLGFQGAAQAKADAWDVAERQFRRALCVNPTFSPAHLNLAECLLRRKDRDQAVREVLLADAFNVGNVYGLSAAIHQYRRKLGISAEQRDPVDAAALSYVSTESISEQDRRLVAVLEGVSKYAVRTEDRAKILNNLAVHFSESGRPELALYWFREALGMAKMAGPERFRLATRILGNMGDTCRGAGFAEADFYQRMQHMVTP